MTALSLQHLRRSMLMGWACCIGACGHAPWDHVDAQARTQQRAVLADHADFEAALTDPEARRAARQVNTPWLAGRATTLAREARLPPAMRADVDTTLLFRDGQSSLTRIAERITQASGIAVRVAPEALLPLHHFLPRLSGADEAQIDFPMTAALPAGPTPLPAVLDSVAARLGVFWRFIDSRIEFYRTASQVFNVRALTVSARADARLGRSGRGGEGGFENTSNTTLSTGEHDTFAALRARIEPFMTRAGVLAAPEGGSGTVVVTDTPDVLARIERFIAAENRLLTRRLRLVFEEVTVNADELQKRGVDWNILYAAGQQAVGWRGPAALVGMKGLSLDVQAGNWRGSSGLLSALSQHTTVLRHTRVPLVTLNRRPVTHAVRTTFTYVDGIQRTTEPGGAAGPGAWEASAAISQKEETVGAFLTVLPDIQEDGRILLSVAYDNTVAQPLRTLNVGQTGQSLQVQQLSIDGSGTVQQLELRSGQTTLIAGFDRVDQSSDSQRLAPGLSMLFGGASSAQTTRVTTLVFITAQIDETGE